MRYLVALPTVAAVAWYFATVAAIAAIALAHPVRARTVATAACVALCVALRSVENFRPVPLVAIALARASAIAISAAGYTCRAPCVALASVVIWFAVTRARMICLV